MGAAAVWCYAAMEDDDEDVLKVAYILESYESFGKVCNSWKDAAATNLNQTIFKSPWLMFAEKDDEAESREFSSISSGLKTTRKIFLPETSKQRCVSCKDWLFVTSPDETGSTDASILHPLSRVQIHLPKLNTLPFYDPEQPCCVFPEKVVISTNPLTNSDYIVVLICGYLGKVIFWKPGDES